MLKTLTAHAYIKMNTNLQLHACGNHTFTAVMECMYPILK